jgi:NAD(P)-dependent dehydrogenase (short-subunit alcohol dehydrogenase family)
MDTLTKFRVDGRIAIITGGAGLLAAQHAPAIAEAGGVPVLWDIQGEAAEDRAREIGALYGVPARGMAVDITMPEAVKAAVDEVVSLYGRVDILINNAANDPKVAPATDPAWSRFENFSLDLWSKDLAVGLTGAFLCSREVGTYMAGHGGGVILNIASDLGVIAPDQRIYMREGLPEDQQPVKPVTYSVVKHGLIGLTKYLATYWPDKKVRVNALSPGGVYTNQPDEFVQKLTRLIPLGRMAAQDEYRAAVLFLVSDASSYMNGANIIIDGGRTCW